MLAFGPGGCHEGTVLHSPDRVPVRPRSYVESSLEDVTPTSVSLKLHRNPIKVFFIVYMPAFYKVPRVLARKMKRFELPTCWKHAGFLADAAQVEACTA